MRAFFILVSILTLALAAPAAASPKNKKTLLFEGRTLDEQGLPLAKARVRIEGTRHASMVTGADGQFSLRIALGTVNDLGRKPLRVAIGAERHGYRLTTERGDRSLGLELRLEGARGEPGRCVARSNDERVAAAAARIVATEGDVVGSVMADFIAVRGQDSGSSAWPSLSAVAVDTLAFAIESPAAATTGRAAASDTLPPRPQPSRSSWSIFGNRTDRRAESTSGDAKPRPKPSSAPTPGGTAAPAPDTSLARALAPTPTPVATPSPLPPTIIPPPAMSSSRARAGPLVIRNAPPTRARADSCECLVEGTVEVQISDEPLKRPERVEVSLQWSPQRRDTVQLFMGSPRPFQLGAAPCGAQRLRLRVLTQGHFDVATRSALAPFRCDGSHVVQQHIVLVQR